jgi:hypothetical protein
MNQSTLHIGTLSPIPSIHLSRYVDKAIAMLAEQPHLRSRANRINVELRDDGLVLNGDLPSYFLKQLAQETLRPLGLAISNQIHVG